MFVNVGTSDLASSPWFMDTGGHDYWVYKETHSRGGWSGFRMGHAVRVRIFFQWRITCHTIELDPKILQTTEDLTRNHSLRTTAVESWYLSLEGVCLDTQTVLFRYVALKLSMSCRFFELRCWQIRSSPYDITGTIFAANNFIAVFRHSLLSVLTPLVPRAWEIG